MRNIAAEYTTYAEALEAAPTEAVAIWWQGEQTIADDVTDAAVFLATVVGLSEKSALTVAKRRCEFFTDSGRGFVQRTVATRVRMIHEELSLLPRESREHPEVVELLRLRATM